MSRTQRVLVGLLAAYAASMTLLASNSAAEAWLYRRCFNGLFQGKHGRPPAFPNLLALAADFGFALTPVEFWFLWLADLRVLLTAPAIILLVLIGLGAAFWTDKRSRTNFDKD